jgi:hypothetical protein
MEAKAARIPKAIIILPTPPPSPTASIVKHNITFARPKYGHGF